ncbi:MAG TPA: hypothetical protein VGV40_04240 [Solirubrobacteraceae bacterium]|nr:hypothetical protein [Solirubrobacteraceae bacterium]
MAAIAALALSGGRGEYAATSPGATKVAAYGDVVVWSERSPEGAFRLVADRGPDGEPAPLPVGQRGAPFDVDVGPGPDGRPVAVYSRCAREPRPLPATWPAVAPATGRGCDLFAYSFATRAERPVQGANLPDTSEFLPSIWRGRIAFARVFEQRPGLAGTAPQLYVRELDPGGRTRRQAGGPRGRSGLPGPTSLDLYKDRLAFGWVWGEGAQGRSEVRLTTLGSSQAGLIAEESWSSTIARLLSPQVAEGSIWFASERTEPRDGKTVSLGGRMHRYRLEDRQLSVAPAPDWLVSAARTEGETVFARAPERDAACDPRCDMVRAGDLAFEPVGGQLPGGGRTILPGKRVVAFFGAPGAEELGALGIGSPAQAGRRLLEQARAYEGEGRTEVLPAMELIASLVLGSPGEDGLYRKRLADRDIARYLKAAREIGAILMLDIQPGRANVLDEVRSYERWLREPDVSLALDPEWRMGPGEVPGQTIGSMTAREINAVSAYLSDVVRRGNLPQKLLLVHRFTDDMIVGEEDLRPREGLATVESVDGFGLPAAKVEKFNAFTAQEEGLEEGFKLFYGEDTNLMSPEDVLALRPRVDVVMYE